MNFVDISVFYDEASLRLSGAPTSTLRTELEATLREFYVRSAAFIIETDKIDVVANQKTYSFNPQVLGDILLTYAVQIYDDSDEAPIQQNFSGTLVPGDIKLAHKPSSNKTDAMSAWVALKPKSYDVIPEGTITYDFDTILDGLTGRMFNMPDRPWSNAPQAAYYLRRFRQGQGQARVRTRSLFTRADAGWRYPPW
jgi:hypothetical protein